jgi:hypothetical protein
MPEALASVPFGFVLVRVRFRKLLESFFCLLCSVVFCVWYYGTTAPYGLRPVFYGAVRRRTAP